MNDERLREYEKRLSMVCVILALLTFWYLLLFVVKTQQKPVENVQPTTTQSESEKIYHPRMKDLPSPTVREILSPEPDTPSLPQQVEFSTARVRGRVLDPMLRPVPYAEVGVYQGSALRGSATSNERGEFEIETLLGEYEVRVHAINLSRHYVVPLRQDDDSRLLVKAPRGTMATKVTLLQPNQLEEVDVYVNWRNSVSGQILDSTGQPVLGARFRMQNLKPGLEKFGFDAMTDEHGYFEIEAVSPGDYRPQVFLSPQHPKGHLTKPFLPDVKIESSPLVMPTIYLGIGEATVSGLVVDQNGKPFPNLHVLVYLKEDTPPGLKPYDWNSSLATTATDEHGRWEVKNLPAVKVGIQIAMDGYSPGRKNNLLSQFVPPTFVDLRLRRVVKLDPVTAHRAHSD